MHETVQWKCEKRSYDVVIRFVVYFFKPILSLPDFKKNQGNTAGMILNLKLIFITHYLNFYGADKKRTNAKNTDNKLLISFFS